MSALCHGCGTQIDEDEDVLCGNCKHDDAIRRELEEWRAIKSAYLIEYAARPNKFHPHQYHGHAHSVDGIWDSDNGALAGCQCIACMVHRAAILGTEPARDIKPFSSDEVAVLLHAIDTEPAREESE